MNMWSDIVSAIFFYYFNVDDAECVMWQRYQTAKHFGLVKAALPKA